MQTVAGGMESQLLSTTVLSSETRLVNLKVLRACLF